ncbi:MAG: hypothetical protein LBF22_08220, partial [Deltaproteobacteria bacterium]|nr:hypothetical protein [Deltaproteobacteria bacterium]
MILRGSKIKEDWEEAKPTKILVFLGIATLVHAIFFLLWGQWGSNFYTPLAIPLEAFGVPLEITLELNSLALNEDLEASLSPDTNLAPTPLPNPALPPELVETHSPPTTPPATPPATPPTTPT